MLQVLTVIESDSTVEIVFGIFHRQTSQTPQFTGSESLEHKDFRKQDVRLYYTAQR